MATRHVRIAVTETANAYTSMPSRVEDLHTLKGRLEAIRAANVAHHITLMRAAKAEGVQVIGFGELFTGPYFALGRDPMWLELAENAELGPTVASLRQAAQELEMVVVAPIYEQTAEGERFNTAVVISNRGELLGKYRKTHLPCGANEKGAFDEPFYYAKSDGKNGSGPANVSHNPYFPVFQTELGRIGVAICYDRHFEGVMSSLAAEGAELVFSPAVTFGAKSERMWRMEFPVDAARHNLFIAGSNRKGTEPPWSQPYFGESFVAGPNGVLPNVSRHGELVIADADFGELSRGDPSGWNLQRDARHEISTRRG